MRRSLGLLMLAVAIASAEACSLFVTTDGLQDESNDASTGSDASDANVSDVGVLDAGSDAPSSPFCLTHLGHTLCADFDEGYTTVGWTQSEIVSGTLTLDTDASVSPPASLVSAIPLDDASAIADARLVSAIGIASPSHVHVELDLNMMCDVSTITTGYLELFKISFGPSFDGSGMELQIDSQGFYFQSNTNSVKYRFSQPIPKQTWTHLVIDVVSGTSGSIEIGLGSPTPIPVLSETSVDTTSGIDGSVYSAVVIGMYNKQGPACTTLFDNVLIDVN